MGATDRLRTTHNLHDYVSMVQEVGAARRGEDSGESIELLIVPKRYKRRLLGRRLGVREIWHNQPVDNTWRTTWEEMPLVIHVATLENFYAQLFIHTGPQLFVRYVENKAAAKGLELTDQGLLSRDKTPLTIPDEAGIFSFVGIKYVAPQERAAFATMNGRRYNGSA